MVETAATLPLCGRIDAEARAFNHLCVWGKRLIRDELREHGHKHRRPRGGEKANTADHVILCSDSEYVDGIKIVERVALPAIARGDLPAQAFIEDLRTKAIHLVEEVPGVAPTALLNGDHHHRSSSSVYWGRSATTEDIVARGKNAPEISLRRF
ncbi:hypothetical protein D9M68_235740 [compost metagenome]